MNQVLVKAIGKRRQASGRKSQIKVTGISMEPTLSEGDGLVVRHMEPGDLALGDIGVFWTGKILFVHRVIDVKHQLGGYRFILKGDRLLQTEDIGGELLFGKVVEVHRQSKRIDLERGFWRGFNKILGYFWKWNYTFLIGLQRMERMALGDRKRSMRFLPSKLFSFGCVFFHQRLTKLCYLFQVR